VIAVAGTDGSGARHSARHQTGPGFERALTGTTAGRRPWTWRAPPGARPVPKVAGDRVDRVAGPLALLRAGRRPTIAFAGREAIFRPAYSGLWALPTCGGHTSSDLLHGRSYHVGDHTRHRRRTLGPASSRFRSGCSLTLSHTPVWPAAPHATGTPLRAVCPAARSGHYNPFSSPGCRQLGAPFPGWRAEMRRLGSTVGLWQRRF
jgi:hypothetical protein